MTGATLIGRLSAIGLALALFVLVCAPLAGAQADGAPQRHVIEIRGFAFAPAALRVSPGDTVVWVNRDLVPHTVTADDGAWDSGTLDEGEAWEMRIGDDVPARSAYFCRHHPSMRGALESSGAGVP